jgi:uncharacterized membrane protein YgdD (TMEM256/DUF423 family)
LDRLLYAGGAVAGLLAVALGAFAAHALRLRLAPDMLTVFETGARYQMYHAFALLAAAWGWSRWRTRAFCAAGLFFGIGIVLFCGSLYALAWSNVKWLGAITPVGGLAFLAGWACLAWGAWRAKTAADD